MQTQIFWNGKKVTAEKLLSYNQLLDSVSVFESMRTYEGVVFLLERHIKRLFESAKDVGLVIQQSPKELENYIKQALRSSGGREVFLRLTVTSEGVFMLLRGKKRYPPNIYKKGVSVTVSSVLKNHFQSSFPEAKASNYLNVIQSYLDPAGSYAFETLFRGDDGYIKEARISNIFIIKNNVLITPLHGILCGITREFVIECARSLKIEVEKQHLTTHDIYSADEAFLTNTSGEIVPVRELNKRSIGKEVPGRWTKRLQKKFAQRVNKYVQSRMGASRSTPTT